MMTLLTFIDHHQCAGGVVGGVSPAKNGTWDIKGGQVKMYNSFFWKTREIKHYTSLPRALRYALPILSLCYAYIFIFKQ